MPESETGIDFVNQVDYTDDFNPYIYKNFYNGGGVAIGDINNDGLSDIFFCGNLQPNKLYLNKGNFQFEDITKESSVASKGVWSTGVSFVDINGDGYLDIYVCKSGTPEGKNRHNELFINNGDLTFTERAKEYGIADLGLSVHAAFFDYDKDGDLDCYLLNNSIRSVGGYDLIKDQREIRDPLGGNKLYRFKSPLEGEQRGVFIDVSEEAGIYGSQIGFGLGVTIGDVNKDGWLDMFVSNDFFERDYLYINNTDGTFDEALEDYIQEISLGSMGADMADINNDTYPEIFVTEMLPENDARMKTTAVFEDWDKYQRNLMTGYYRQFPRNVLQLNIEGQSFSEIGRLAGVHATDWSWGALILDMDNDGLKDLFVANGIYKDLTDHDYINYMADPATIRQILIEESMGVKKLIDMVPSNPIPNYAFQNQGELTFENRASEWGLNIPSHSNGSAYGDLDNDGDLDLVVNNVNMPSFVFRNNAEMVLENNNYLMFKLVGERFNTYGLGTKITIRDRNSTFYQELAPFRGFQSTVDPRIHFGLGNIDEVDSVIVQWLDGRRTILTDVPTNQEITIYQKKASGTADFNTVAVEDLQEPVFTDVSDNVSWTYQHVENDYVDFDRDRLLFHMRSNEGPKMCKGDVNGDGLEDIFIAGAKDAASTLLIQESNMTFRKSNQALFQKDAKSEDTDCLFFDADGDGDPDLYVASGGNEYSSSSSVLRDRLYMNDGNGSFTRSPQVLPTLRFESTSSVDAADYDNDGDIDLFVGIRLRPFLYGVPVNGYILENDGRGNFTNVTEKIAPELMNVGLITDGLWFDFDNDKDLDLAVAGEWMPVKIFKNQGSVFSDFTESAGLDSTNGFWNTLETADLDGDGDLDLIGGNMGLNTRFRATRHEPVKMVVNDFDKNGTAEQIISVYNNGKSYPMVLRDDLIMQIPVLKKKYLKYHSYKEQTVEDIFSEEQLKNAIQLHVFETHSSIFVNNGDGTFSHKPLPLNTQFSIVYGMEIADYNQDGHLDIVLGGNLSKAKPETGIYNASYGVFLQGDGKLNFESLSPNESGFFTKGELRDFLRIQSTQNNFLLVGRNNDKLKIFKY